MGRQIILVSLCVALCCGAASAQGVLGDVLAGKLVQPEVGVFAWYDLTEAATGKIFFLRQAIVGKERVKGKTGYWVETEVVPQVGFPSVYKMLLTGPAKETENVHRIVVREGNRPPREVPVEPEEEKEGPPEPERIPVGTEKIKTPQGTIETTHFVFGEGAGQTEVWLSDEVRPMGIVRLKSAEGELIVRRFGTGGEDARSALDRETPEATSRSTTTKVKPESGVTTNFSGRRKKE